jgi:hypothetical protein
MPAVTIQLQSIDVVAVPANISMRRTRRRSTREKVQQRVFRSMRGRCHVSDDTNASGASPRGSDVLRRAQHGLLQAVLSLGMYSDSRLEAPGEVCE